MTLTVSLNDEMTRYFRDKVESGQYASFSAVIQDALLLLEEREEMAHDADRLREG